MNDLQRKELELLKCFIKVCETLNLKYYLVCGSALGAVKYNGFIPWDDDVDVALPRDDYDIFIKNAQCLFPEHVFLQNYQSDSAFPYFFSKLRDSSTTYIEKSVAHLPINHGVYIDVFPLDGYPKDEKEIKRFERKKRIYSLQLSCVYEAKRSLKGNVLCSIERMLGYHKRTLSTVMKIEKLISKYSVDTSSVWCNHGNWQGKLEYAPREQYGDGAIMKFEGIDVRVPAKYDDYLRQKYGDYRKDLPLEQQAGHHYYEVLDLLKPYTAYIKS